MSLLTAPAVWQQRYDPMGDVWLSTAGAAFPIVCYFVALVAFRMPGWRAALLALSLTLIVATVLYGMPMQLALAAAGLGFFYGLWPVAAIILAALFLFRLAELSGHVAILKESVVSITDDARLQLLLVGFGLGALLEGLAGFGAPVAITTALLVRFGFPPLSAATLCLIANTAPVAFGAAGIPVIVAGQLTGIDPFVIGQVAGRQLPLLSLMLPAWLIVTLDGWRGLRATWPAAVVAGGSFAVVQFLTANFVGPELPDITAGLASIVALGLFLRLWRPAQSLRFGGPSEHNFVIGRSPAASWRGWLPFLILAGFVALWSSSVMKGLFGANGPMAWSTWTVPWGPLDHAVMRMPPLASGSVASAAVLKLDWLGATATAIGFAALTFAALVGMPVRTVAGTFAGTLRELGVPIVTIGLVLSFAFLANFSGLSSTLALALAHSGRAFPFLSPFVGWLGVFLTGSDTSSNALFASLQAATANSVGMSDVLAVAANTTGGVTGKMVSPQSIAIAAAALGLIGREADLFRRTLRHSLSLCLLVGVIVFLQSNVLSGLLP